MSHIIGIDLGTTNSTLASASLEDKSFAFSQLPISQLGRDGNTALPLQLPSFLLFPLKGEREEPFVIGEYARDRGQELPLRLVSSAKSWLSCVGINLHEKFLPLSAQSEKEDFDTLSPIEVSAIFLKAIKDAWQNAHPEIPFNSQKIIVTVPASFEPHARELVLQAASNAGFPEITLIEEPLAAFYAWLSAQEDKWREHLQIGDQVLVVDIGGGTSDFTLITVSEKEGDLALERMAVGSHLLLGGDNIDLTLAYHAKAKIEKEGHKLDTWQFQSLVMQARKAKELLLSLNAPEKTTLFVESRGSSLIGGSLTVEISKEEIQRILLDGFFPFVAFGEKAMESRQSGIGAFGLPYARDARITAHLATFLARSCGERLPTKILFNGGTMKSDAFRKRIIDQLNIWAAEKNCSPIIPLEGGDFDFAVSRGAVFYGWTTEKEGIRVKAGTSRSYFIGVEGVAPAVPGMKPPLHALCIVPLGTEEGSKIFLPETFNLVVGEEAQFQFFSSPSKKFSGGDEIHPGTFLEEVDAGLTKLNPIVTHLSSEGMEAKTVGVKIHAHITEMGMLDLWFEGENSKRWKLAFNLRQEQIGD